MYEAEQRRLLYVATTRARDHLVLSLFHGRDPSHATRIVERLATKPALSTEVTLTMRPPVVAPETPPVASAPLTPESHRAAEAAWLATRQSQIASLAIQALIAPSRMAHDAPPPPTPDPPPEPDPQTYVRRTPRGRAATALGRAVHAVLQVIHLATLANLEPLATAAARDEAIPDLVPTIIQYVRNAAASAPVQDALASGRYWREVPVGVLSSENAILEGAIDLLYEAADGALHVVDYKTDSISDSEISTSAQHYRAQGLAYAQAVTLATAKRVAVVSFVFTATARHVDMDTDLEVPAANARPGTVDSHRSAAATE